MTTRALGLILPGARRSSPRPRPEVRRKRSHRNLRQRLCCCRAPHQRWVAQHGRSTVGLSGLSMMECARCVADWLRGAAPPSPRDGFSAPLILRFAVDDVKAYCLEAAAAGPAHPSSRQLGDWFWDTTATGAAIYALREALQAQEDERLRLIVSNFMVPAARVRMD
jgi:hypothetical protein